MPTLDDLKRFSFEGASATLWTFKYRVPKGENPIYTGRWVDITADVQSSLLQICSSVIPNIDETIEYSLLAQNSENSVLTIPAIETHSGLIVASVGQESDDRKITKIKDIHNSKFYVIKVVSGDDILYAVKKTESNWMSKRAFDRNHLFFKDQRLTLETEPHFEIYRSVDFFVFGDTVFCLNKKNFESILNYKQAHKEDFQELQQEQEFQDAFADMQPLVEFIGVNKTRLRRASAIKQKGHYKDPVFMGRLKDRHEDYKLQINFDDAGKILATNDSCADIMTALLDHRLGSGFSEGIFDVPSTTPV